MQITFVTVILVGSSVIAVLSVNAGLQTRDARAKSAICVGAVIWFVTAVALFVCAKRANADDGGMPPEAELDTDIDTED